MSQIAKYLFAIFLVSSYKTVPFAFLIRFYYRIFKTIVLPRNKFLKNARINTFGITGENKLDVFNYTVMNTYVSPLEVDMYLHKSNSTYFLDLDIARCDLVCKIFQKVFYDFYDNLDGEFKFKGKLSNFPYVPVAAIECTFKRELKPFQRYQIKSRILAWDQKWIFVLSKFVIPNKGEEQLCAIAVTKYVFKKNGRITITPEELIKKSGLWNEDVVVENTKNYEIIKYMSSTEDLESICSKF